MDDTDAQGVVILVVGNVQEEKACVVECLTKIGSWEKHTTAAGVRILTHKSGAQVIDTIPLRNVQGKSPSAIGRRWVSQNSLRRILFGKMVFVVCVVTYAIVEEPCNQIVLSSYNCWMDVMGLIFACHKDIMILANMEGKILDKKSQRLLNHCLLRHGFSTKNVHFSNSTTDETTKSLVEVSIRKKYPCFCSLSNEMTTFDSGALSRQATCGTPFLFKPRSQVKSGRDRFGPWGPERVFLFGRTGSGKSTLAQMLTLGKLDRNGTKFKTSSGIRGGTQVIERGEGRGWYVVDTPGFGEPDCEDSTVTTLVAQNKVKKFVEWDEGTFSHYLFVLKKDRIDQLEVRLWRFFRLLFGERLNHHFSIVISNADDEWLEGNICYLRESFEGCSSFLAAEFPLEEMTGDEELHIAYEELRTNSLRLLEEELAKFGRPDLHCEYGEHSKMHRLSEKSREHLDTRVGKSTASLIDITEKLGLVSMFGTLDDLVYSLGKALSADIVKLEPE